MSRAVLRQLAVMVEELLILAGRITAYDRELKDS